MGFKTEERIFTILQNMEKLKYALFNPKNANTQ